MLTNPRSTAWTRWSLVMLIVFGSLPLWGQEGGGGSSTSGESTQEAGTTEDPPPPTPSPPPTPRSTGFPPTSADADPGAVIYYDLETGRIEWLIEGKTVERGNLPFDVQFYLRIPVDETVVSLTGRYAGSKEPILCDEVFPRTQVYVDYGSGARELLASERRQMQPIGQSRFFDDPDKKKRHAELNVAYGLLPNRNYCFEFRRVRKITAGTATQAFQQEMVKVIDAAYRRWNRGLAGDEARRIAHIDPRVYEGLRADLILTVEAQLKPGERLILPPNSFLHRTQPVGTIPPESRLPFDQLAVLLGKRADRIQNFLTTAEELSPWLEKVVTNPDLEALRKASETTSVSPALSALLQGAREPSRLALLGGLARSEPKTFRDALHDLAQGTEGFSVASTTAQPLTLAWVPADLKTRRENLVATKEALEALKKVLAVLSGGSGLRAESGVTDLLALQGQITRTLKELGGVLDYLDTVADALAQRLRRLDQVVADLAKEQIDLLRAEGTTMANLDLSAGWYFSMDLGIGWSPDIEDLFAYIGTNLYLRPVNKRAPLRWSDFRKGQRMSEFLKRFSVTAGITLDKLEKDGQFKGPSQQTLTVGLLGDKPLVLGAGFRLSRLVRVSAAALVFKDRDPDPLVNREKLAWSPMFSVSIDWNFRGSLRERFGARPAPY